MKNFVLLIFLTVVPLNLFAQNETGSNSYILPYGIDNPESFDAKTDLDEYQLYLNPVGWSPKGLFAYQTGFYDGHFSGVKLVIFDTVNDKLVEEAFITTYAPGEDIIEEYDEDIAQWNKILEKYQINKRIPAFQETTRASTLQNFPLQHNSRNLLCWFENKTVPGKYSDERNVTWELFAGDTAIRKRVSSGEESSYMFTGAKILGYFKSPFEERIVILTIFRDGGFESEYWKVL
ncbi:MAG: hypothetical protein LBK13_03675, partial [Spirochaetales bacterium]|nr:hypothetical protein [Spirochaetales bacterium]